MKRAHRPRRWLAGWLIATLLFMQLAAAAYACPSAALGANAAAAAELPDCHKGSHAAKDPAQAPLCKAHCEQGQQAVKSPQATDAAGAVWQAAALDWRPLLRLASPLPGPGAEALPAGAPPPGAPPIYLALQVLRN